MYEDANKVCKSCPKYCELCVSKDVCTKCSVEDNTILKLNECVCKDGYYMEGGICTPCGFKCDTCVDKADNCTKCTDVRTNLPKCDECPKGFFDDNKNEEC